MINEITNLFINSYLYMVLLIPFFFLFCLFLSKDEKEYFDNKLLVLLLILDLFLTIIIYCNPFNLCSYFNNISCFVIILVFCMFSALSLFCRNFFLSHHQFISKLIVISILSFIFIIAVPIESFEYILFSVLILLFIIVSYSYIKNVKVFLYTSIFLIVNLILFVATKGLNQCINFNYLIYTIILALILIISIFYCKNEKEEDNNKFKNLFSERQYDLKKIIEYLEQYNLIGINSAWGNGKSFLFEMLKEKEKGKYFFINISVLTLRIEKIESYVVNEMCNILENNRIFTQSSKRIKGLFQQSFFHDLGEMFFGFNSYIDSINKLKAEIKKLSCPIVITFEDIDRVSDKDIIYKIFSLADIINDAKIKIVFQYEEKKLLDIIKEDKCYIEKYIPYTLTLTTIPFEIMIKKVLLNQKYSLLSKDDFLFLNSQVYIPIDLQKVLNIKSFFNINIHNCNIRKIEIFFDDIMLELKKERFKEVCEYRKKFILFYFIKHFDYKLFEYLKDDISFTDTKMFSFNDNMYSIVDLFENVYNKEFNNDNIEKILNNDNNRLRMIYYILFDFDSSIIIKNIKHKKFMENIKDKKIYLREKLNLNQDIKEIKAQEKNDKINRMIKNLIGSGKSENTDFENAVKEMNEKVLNLPKEQQDKGYEELSKIMYYGNFEKSDNKTIFKIGISSEYSLFQAYLFYENSSEQWNKLIDFFIKPERKIDCQLIQTLNYCKIDNKKVFLHIIDLFSHLEIAGNLNKTISYKNFVYTYFNAIYTHGFSKDRLYGSEDRTLKDFFSIVEGYAIPHYLKYLEKLKKLSNNENILSEINKIENFVKHNEDILKNETELQEYIPRIKVTSTISDHITEKSEEYKKHKYTKEQLQKILDEQYLKGEINMYEYRCYMINVFGENL